MATVPKIKPQHRELEPGMIDAIGADVELFDVKETLEMKEQIPGGITKESWGGLG